MGIRMSGLISNLDTETIVKQLMDAQSQKKVKIENKKTKLEWTQEKWKDLNTKLYKLYTDQVSALRLQSSYKTRVIKSSNESAVTAKAKDISAPLGSHTVEVKELASSQFVTGAKLGNNVTSATKLYDLLDTDTASSPGKLHVVTVTSGEGSNVRESRLVVNENTTVRDFVNACQSAGLSASFDASQKRLFISSLNSGKENSFTITTAEIDSANNTAKTALDGLVNYNLLSLSDRGKVESAYNVLMKQGLAMNPSDFDQLTDLVMSSDKGSVVSSSNPALQSIIDNNKSVVSALVTFRDFADTKAEDQTKSNAVKQIKNGIKSDILNRTTTFDPSELNTYKALVQNEIDNGSLVLDSGMTVESVAKERIQRDHAIKSDLYAKFEKEFLAGTRQPAAGQTQADAIDALVTSSFNVYNERDKNAHLDQLIEREYNSADAMPGSPGLTKKKYYEDQVQQIYDANITGDRAAIRARVATEAKNYTHTSALTPSASTNSMLTKLGMDEITSAAVSALPDGKGTIGGASVVASSDSKIILNGAEVTGTTNSITANGITFDISAVTTGPVSLTVSNDTQATYDLIKNFVKEYNAILKEMNTLYYADSARGYEPLTDDERSAMTDDQIEKWENKIKGSLLRRDDILGSVMSSMKSAVMGNIKINGKSYSLANFGIQTSNDYTEKGLLHIFGDKEDSTYLDKDDKLMEAITNDPEVVTQFFSQLGMNLYETMSEKMKGSSLSSAMTFYNDKQMTNQIRQYKKDIAAWEKKLNTMEDRYYKQFTAMEKALAQLNSQSSSLSSMMGGN